MLELLEKDNVNYFNHTPQSKGKHYWIERSPNQRNKAILKKELLELKNTITKIYWRVLVEWRGPKEEWVNLKIHQ